MVFLSGYLTRIKAGSSSKGYFCKFSRDSAAAKTSGFKSWAPLLATTPCSAPRFLVVYRTFSVGLPCICKQSSWTGFKILGRCKSSCGVCNYFNLLDCNYFCTNLIVLGQHSCLRSTSDPLPLEGSTVTSQTHRPLQLSMFFLPNYREHISNALSGLI